MNWFDFTGGYRPQGSQSMGGLLGNGMSLGMYAPQMQALFANYGQPMFPQYGGNTRSAQMMNNYMGGLLSRRQGYQPPSMPNRAAIAAAPTPPGYGVTNGGYDQYSPVTGG